MVKYLVLLDIADLVQIFLSVTQRRNMRGQGVTAEKGTCTKANNTRTRTTSVNRFSQTQVSADDTTTHHSHNAIRFKHCANTNYYHTALYQLRCDE